MELYQLRQLRNLNVELLETTLQILHFMDDFCIKNGIPLPSEKSLMNLVRHALGIIAEINTEVALPPSVQHLFQTPSNEIKTLSDESLQVENPTQTLQNPIKYWEKRYAAGSHSGRGSYGRLAKFKADFLNEFVQAHKIETVVDFGCGDGNMASLFDFPNYVGIDPSKSAIKRCIERCEKDTSKSFLIYLPGVFQDIRAELTLSLDVIYHLIEYDVFELYMKHLFTSSSKYVIIYSTNIYETTNFPHIKHRRFTDWIANNMFDWVLSEYVSNKHPDETDADFYVYKLREKGS